MKKKYSYGRINLFAYISDNPFEDAFIPLTNEILCHIDGNIVPEKEVYRRLGQIYIDGISVEENGQKGCRYLEIAYDKGARDIRDGDYLMMGVYRHLETREAVENGLTRNLVLALKWYMCCLERANGPEDQHWINLIYSHMGRALMDDEIMDYKSAFEFLNLACHQESEALFYLGIMYERGLYVKRSREKAQECFNRILCTSKYKNDVFYDAAEAILYCWSEDAPQEYIDEILFRLG